MSSVINGFEYDIFISYRQKDNKYEGWVNEFVTNLQRELEATCKKEISIYFDENPTDGLLENHNVSLSLEGKLKCLIFIPIISRTYCDPKSFAWQNELIRFNEIAKKDRFGREVKLSNGNVSSRILPVKIHDLDNYDKILLEKELGTFLRPVEFIFRSPGVNRPLRPNDTRTDNQSHIYYRDQINKVANVIKDIIYAMEYPELRTDAYKISTNNLSEKKLKLDSRKRIAVMPFTDLSPDKTQEYLGDGMSVELITMLSQVKELKVTGRSSSFSFKNGYADLKSIRDALNVEIVLEGSIQKFNNKVRITVQLVSTMDGYQIWSQRYDRNMDDIFELQDDICSKIVENLKLTLLKEYFPGRSARNALAYEMFLKGDYFDKLYTREGFQKAIEYFKKALEIDPTYADAWWYLGLVNFELHGFLYLEKDRLETVIHCANKSLSLDPDNANAHFLLALVHFNIDYDWEIMNHELMLGNENTRTPFPIVFTPLEPWIKAMIYGDFGFAVKRMQQAVDHDPFNLYYQFHLSHIYLFGERDYGKSITILQNIMELGYPEYYAYRLLCLAYLFNNDYKMAEKYALKDYNYSNGKGHGASNLIVCYACSGKFKEAAEIYNKVNKTLDYTEFPELLHAKVNAYLGDMDKAFTFLNRAIEEKNYWLFTLKYSPEWDILRSDPRFALALDRMKFPK